MTQGTEEWHTMRLGKVTASKIADVMMKPTTAGYQNYRAQLVCERLTGQPTEGFVSAAMVHGTETEPQARAMYSLLEGYDVAEVDFVDHPTIPMTGASPDGLVGSDGLVEIKCPQPATHIKTLTGGNIDRKYMLQMHWQMACTGRDWCDFVSFCPSLPTEMQMHCQRVERDEKALFEIIEAVEAFLASISDLERELKAKFEKAAAA
ncbi:lambda exonuclease family protein [uncultured Roseobacter sp.]|uniref:lambda exonuclease family protein n=1 Tax=uncultured Roseobacter sp. TaxID=114847 RepID=UPI002614A744|nr:lambda exonuclease family protein [uncultured Roseobacter sp.]